MDMDQYNTINNKLDRLDGRIDRIDITLAKQSVILEDHQRRSIANEANIEMLRKDDVAPMKEKWAKVEGGIKLLAWCVGGAGFVLGILQIISYFHRF